MTSQRLSNIYL